jgi:hypothetical protein
MPKYQNKSMSDLMIFRSIMIYSSFILSHTHIAHLRYSLHAPYAFTLFLAHIMHVQDERHAFLDTLDEMRLARSHLFSLIDDASTNADKVDYRSR